MAANISDEQNAAPKELQTKLDRLKASATQQYSLKNYDAAAEFYSEAAELQDEVNGEMSLDNADLLYQYGRCLYHVAVGKSDVLGGKVASTDEPKRKKRKVAESGASGTANGGGAQQELAEEVLEPIVEEKDSVKAQPTEEAKPFFQITGDENWTDSEDEDELADGEAEAEEEDDDDFATAFEILDTARVLLGKKLAAAQQAAGKAITEYPEIRQLQERLADTHDLQAEISLENERFQDAIGDTRDALALKLQLYPQESSLVAEAHFKLSLALEFSSVTSTAEDPDAKGDAETKVAQVDESMRREAADEMEKAVASCKLRISKEEESLSGLGETEAEKQKRSIADVREMVGDMEQRLLDLRNPAVSLAGAGGAAGASDGAGGDELRGVLGAMLGESKAEQQKRIADATAQANDVSGLVKHKRKARAVENDADAGAGGKGKRKSEDVDEGGVAGNGKRARVEDA
ncbi:hypothetical protein LTR62_002430 [Meristemomyces frigidus]|uniref:Tetratricopeptide SHNi-TPR domain-containing protein n=1 Tax=Meristemomyces frigidus TaxID=1508187 RepID=A0AAN7TKR3_9PEZI|nr:hypothetical protein LTR62_002430 [Meristemomyces frigidus]